MSSQNTESVKKLPNKTVETAFLFGVAGISILSGFSMALAMAKKKDPSFFFKGMLPSKEIPESGSSLAMRALGWGTLYATAGFSAFCFTVWKLMGVKDLQEFRLKVGNLLPKVPKSENPGRSDFESVRDLLNYVIEESEKSKKS